MSNGERENKERFTKIAVCVAILLALIGGGAFLAQENEKEEARKRDPENILGLTIGEIRDKYCENYDVRYFDFYIMDQRYTCYDFDEKFIDSDMNNYILDDYKIVYDLPMLADFTFRLDNSQTDQRPLTIDNPEQFVGQMATAICPKYSLAEFIIFAGGDRMGISTVPCKDINQYNMYKDIVITDVYYGADEKSGDDPTIYYEENNTKGTRYLYFDGESINN